MITASGIARLRACPGSAVLPRAENHNEWADAGHDDHEKLALALDGGTLSDVLAELLPEGVDAERIAAAVPAGSRAEVKLGFCVATRVGRVIGYGGGRDYGTPGPFEIVGSTDVLGVLADAVVVIDWKTGFADVEPAETNAQLWFYALAACKALGKTRAIVRIIYTKSGRIDECEAGPLELAEFADQLEALHRRVASAQVTRNGGEMTSTKEGIWCKHCPSKHVCPSKVGLLAQIASQGLAVIGDTEMTATRAAQAYEQVSRIEQLVKEARKRLETYVDEQGPIDLGDGRMFGRYHRRGNEKLDGAVTVKAIREVVGEQAKEFEAIAIGYTTSKAAIERAAKQLISVGATKVTKAVIARVKELGGVSSSPTYPIGEFPAGKYEPAQKPEIDTAAVNQMLAAAGE